MAHIIRILPPRTREKIEYGRYDQTIDHRFRKKILPARKKIRTALRSQGHLLKIQGSLFMV